jgi:hypothetical protein
VRIAEIANNRLVNQQIVKTKFTKAQQIVKWLAAMQAQDFTMAKWAIGLRLPGLTESDIDNSFNEAIILRTHILRPTWHFITPHDIRWMLKISAPRVHAFNSFMYRSLELDKKILTRACGIITKSLIGKNFKNRNELKEVLKLSKISGNTLRYAYIIMYAELEGLITSGPRIGKQFTYALLDERASESIKLDYEESIAELTRRYFTSRGPASIKDFIWWSGLTVKDAKAGIEVLSSDFKKTMIEGTEYIHPEIKIPENINKLQKTFLMPDYDEYGISYKDRSGLKNPKVSADKIKANSTDYSHWLVIDGFISGTWNRIQKSKQVTAETALFTPITAAQKHALNKAVEKYCRFFNTK